MHCIVCVFFFFPPQNNDEMLFIVLSLNMIGPLFFCYWCTTRASAFKLKVGGGDITYICHILLVILLPVFDWPHVGQEKQSAGIDRVHGCTHDSTDDCLQEDEGGVGD